MSLRSIAPWFALAVVAALLACGPKSAPNESVDSKAPPPATSEQPRASLLFNVFVLVLDSCRADKIGAYGFERPTTPALDALARDPDAVLFHRHYAQATHTKPSTASLFTGLLVRQHGVDQRLHVDEATSAIATEVLDSGFPMLAEYFQRAGAFTFAGVKSYHLIPDYGFARGFDAYFSPRNFDANDFRLTRLTRFLIAGSQERFFGYVHLNACHHPFMERIRDPDYMERYGFDYDEAASKGLGIDFTTAGIMHAIRKGEIHLDEQDVRFLNLVYEAKLRTVDKHFISPILASFAESGKYDDTLIVVTADHGEELYEHLGYAHGHALWQEITRVPLIVKFPKGRRPPGLDREVHAPTRTIDLTASLIRMAGGEPPPGATGVAMLHGEIPTDVISERPDGEWAFIRDGYRLIRAGGRDHLFQIRDDFEETRDRAEVEPEHVREMERLAQSRFEEVAPEVKRAEVVENPFDPKEVEALRSLGYVD